MMYMPAGKVVSAALVSDVLTSRLPAMSYISAIAGVAVTSLTGVAVLMVKAPVTLVTIRRPRVAS